MKPNIVCIVGPTASGKTALAVDLCLERGGEVVSCDSMQIYRGLPIATAQPTEEERRGVPHHLIGVLEPQDKCTAARYAGLASACVEDILARGKLPVVVGGTGLYIAALLGGLRLDAPAADPKVRLALEEQAASEGWASLYEELNRLAPDAGIPPQDHRRILRALEILRSGGTFRPVHPSASLVGPDCPWEPELLGLTFPNREDLYARINARTDDMFRRGLVQEVLSARGTGGVSQAIGYKEILAALAAGRPADSAREAVKQATRRYAKRQLTWFRRDPAIRWIAPV